MGTNQTITATFSEPMNAASIVASGTFTVNAPGPVPVAGTVTYDATNNTAIFTPTGTFATGTAFSATITTAAQSAALLPLASNFIWTFTTGASTDTTAPLVSSTNPANAAVGVATNQKITATFDKGMDSTTLTAISFTLAAPGPVAVPGTVTYSTIGATATFTPSSVLTANTIYTATITSGAKDLSGNALASSFTWSFTTGPTTDSIAPTVASTNPANSAIGVGIDAAVNATFDKAMDCSTLNPATFTVTGPGATVVVGKVSYDVPDQIVTFTPTSALAASTTFTATISDGALDLAGNALPAFVWTFTTGSTTTGLSSIDLGAATNFAVLAQASVTNLNATVVNGDLGVTPAGLVTGFPPGVVNGAQQINNAPAAAALASLTNAYNTAAGLSGPTIIAENLAGQTLAPGLYVSNLGSFEITAGTLTLDGQGDSNAVWVFQMPTSTLTLTALGCSIILENGAQASNIFWQVGTSATIGAGCVLEGSMLTNTSILLATGASMTGRALAGAINATGAVTMDTNPVSLSGCN